MMAPADYYGTQYHGSRIGTWWYGPIAYYYYAVPQ